jgi:surfeit locus 1 family protein
VVTPLIRKGLPPVLVDRGWVPMEAKDQNKRAAGDVQGRVTVTGTVQVPRRRGLFTPENDPAAGFWIVADPASMALAAGIAAPLAVIVAADHPTGRGRWPVPRGGPPSISDNHMIYALTWYSLALILAVIAIIRLALNHDRHSSL